MSRAGAKARRRVLVTGMLAWRNEPPEMLRDCVASTGCVLDRIIALDGGYQLTPGATVRSPPGEYQAIKDGAEIAGIECVILTPKRIWAGQVEKRDWLIKESAKDSDFVMPIDADWLLSGDRRMIHDELQAFPEHDAFGVQFATPLPDDSVDMVKRAAHEWHAEQAAQGSEVVDLIFRSLKGIRVEIRHWFYSGLKDGKRRGLWGCIGLYPPVPRRDLAAPLLVRHMTFFRDQFTIDRNRIYSARRDLEVAQTGAES